MNYLLFTEPYTRIEKKGIKKKGILKGLVTQFILLVLKYLIVYLSNVGIKVIKEGLITNYLTPLVIICQMFS
jgi:hypothetical protein